MLTVNSDTIGGPDFEIAWEVVTPNLPPERFPLLLLPAIQCLVDAFGPITLRRIDPAPHRKASEITMYFLNFSRFLAMRQDGSWNGPGSVCFYGIGGSSSNLNGAISSAYEQVGYFRGCVAVSPPREIYGPVKALSGIDLYGNPYPAINRDADMKLAMDHAIGRVPEDWPIHCKLEAL